MAVQRLLGSAALACLFALVGCDAQDARFPVTGKIMLGEKPLHTGTVILRPDPEKGNASKHEPRGKIDADGTYRVETALVEGAPPGWYKIGVMAFEPRDPKSFDAPLSLIPTKYQDPDLTGIAFEVVKNPAAGAYDINLDPAFGDLPPP